MMRTIMKHILKLEISRDSMKTLLSFIYIFQTGFMFNALITRLSKDPIPEDIVFVIPLFCLAILSTVATITLERYSGS